MGDMPAWKSTDLDDSLRRSKQQQQAWEADPERPLEEVSSGSSGGSKRDSRTPLHHVTALPLGRPLPGARTIEQLAQQISARARTAIPSGFVEDIGSAFSSLWAWIVEQFRRITGRTDPAPAQPALPRARALLCFP